MSCDLVSYVGGSCDLVSCVGGSCDLVNCVGGSCDLVSLDHVIISTIDGVGHTCRRDVSSKR